MHDQPTSVRRSSSSSISFPVQRKPWNGMAFNSLIKMVKWSYNKRIVISVISSLYNLELIVVFFFLLYISLLLVHMGSVFLLHLLIISIIILGCLWLACEPHATICRLQLDLMTVRGFSWWSCFFFIARSESKFMIEKRNSCWEEWKLINYYLKPKIWYQTIISSWCLLIFYVQFFESLSHKK